MKLQSIAKTMWALAMLAMPPAGSLRDALWTAAELEAPSIQDVVVLALAMLDTAPSREDKTACDPSHVDYKDVSRSSTRV
jgi:hypothetical protein